MEGEVTKYGFRWGPMEVTRACADGRYHTLLIFTDHQELQVSVSPTGRSIRVHKSKRSKPPPKAECAGCGFAHAPDYKDCVWLKNPY